MSRNRALKPATPLVHQPDGDAQIVSQPFQIPAVCFIEDVSRALRMSRRSIERLRQFGTFPIPEMCRLDKRPRWNGAAVEAFLRETSAHQGVTRFHARHRRARTA